MDKRPMSPAAFRVACPGCGRETDIADHDWCENFNGVFEVMDAARFPVCEYCGVQFEIAPVTVAVAADANPCRARADAGDVKP
jgi:hypothetical protein